jgi:hypothetical protein
MHAFGTVLNLPPMYSGPVAVQLLSYIDPSYRGIEKFIEKVYAREATSKFRDQFLHMNGEGAVYLEALHSCGHGIGLQIRGSSLRPSGYFGSDSDTRKIFTFLHNHGGWG